MDDALTVLGFDFGMKHIGVAVGQSITGSATPVATLAARDGIPDWEDITQLIERWQPKGLVVGVPFHLDGSTQLMTFCARRFIHRLDKRFGLPVHEVDEQLTSWEAKHRGWLKPTAYKQKRIEQERHAYAAAILVEQWMSEQATAIRR